MRRGTLLVTAFATLSLAGAASAHADIATFKLLRSNGAAGTCAPHATATVKVATQPGADNFAEKRPSPSTASPAIRRSTHS